MNRIKSIAAAAALLGAGAAALAQDAGKVYVVRTGRPSRQTVSQSIRKTGGLVSPAEVAVGSKIPGRLLALELADGTRLEEGAKVRKGDRIAEIDPRDYQAQLDAAMASVASAEATVRDTKREFERADTLFVEGTATAQERDQAEANFERAQAALAQAKAKEAVARIDLGECTVYAPMDGVVSKRSAEPGALLSAGSVLATVTQLDPLRFQLAVPTTLFARLSAGETRVSIDVDAYPGEPVEARVSRIYPVADDATRTVRVEATVANPDGRFVPGMYAVGTIDLDRREDVLCVPFDCVVRNGAEYIVYRVEDGVARAARVRLGVRADAIVEVAEGLADGDVIVVAGQHRLTDGARVKEEVLP